jgi:hypothetical protein
MGSNDSSLADRLSALEVESEFTKFPDSYPELNPVDIFRCFVSENLAKISGVHAVTIYPALQWTQNLDKGDLNLAIPRLRLKGKPPNDLAKQWAEAVSMLGYSRRWGGEWKCGAMMTRLSISSSLRTSLYRHQSPVA